MRFLTCAAILLTCLSVAHADEALSPQTVAALKSATVFVKIKSAEMAGSGSGFVIAAKGDTAYIVTNRHVVEPKVPEVVVERHGGGSRYGRGRRYGAPGFAPPMIPPFPSRNEQDEPSYSLRVVVRDIKDVEVTAVFQSGTTQEESVAGKLLAIDPDEDLAIIKVSGIKRLPGTIEYRQEPQLTETMPIYVFGFPLGEELSTSKRSPAITVGTGTVSSLRTDDDGKLSVVQLDAALNHGNSGGPVVDAKGRLVGVAVARIESESSQNISLAIPSQAVVRLLRGRLGSAVLTAVRDGDDHMHINVSASLIDPLNEIKSVKLHYLAATAGASRPKPTDPLAALPGCRTLDLKLENGVASGTISIKKGITEISLLQQAVSIDGSGKQAVSNSAFNKLALAPPPPAVNPNLIVNSRVVPNRVVPNRSAVQNPSAVHGERSIVASQKAAATDGGSIGIHFIGNGEQFRGAGGVVPMRNWNNESGFLFSGRALVDNTGVNSGATFSLDGGKSIWSTGSANELLNGYAASSNFEPMTLTVSGIVYAQYSIYIYVGDSTLGCEGKVTANGSTYYYATEGGGPVAYSRVTNTNAQMHEMGNYIEIDGLTGYNQTVTLTGTAQQFGGLCGVEIVETSSAATRKKAPPAMPPVASAAPPVSPRARPGGMHRPGDREQVFGGHMGEQFRDVAPSKGVLVGFEVGLGKWGSNTIVSALRPIFLDEHGKDVLGEQHGTVNGQVIRVKAKQGYAVGAITAKSLIAIDGFSLTFMKIDKDHLDPADKYESDWSGGQGGMPETTASGNGAPAIGIIGHCNNTDCTAVGLVFAPAKAAE